MKVALVSWTSRQSGGVETYLDTVIPALAAAGYELAHLCEVAGPADRAPITLPPGAPTWCAATSAPDALVAGLAAWHPAVIFMHGLREPALEAALAGLAPTVFYAHDYYGACISGAKSFSFPRARPCGCSFDWRCLARFYPRRCGGLNPLTTWRLYRRETRRLALLRRYAAVVVDSTHMRRELLRQGLEPARVRTLTPPFPAAIAAQRATPAATVPAGAWQLLFAGRMDELKGGATLLRALPAAARALRRPLHVVMAGDGPARPAWEALARRVMAQARDVAVEFPGWLAAEARDAAMARADLHLMPSRWPEPFGRAGLDAAGAGVPSVAFAVGGIPEWLRDGVNGHLAPGDPPTGAGLAAAIVRSLADPAHHAALRRGARAARARFQLDRHRAQLDELFSAVSGGRGAAPRQGGAQ